MMWRGGPVVSNTPTGVWIKCIDIQEEDINFQDEIMVLFPPQLLATPDYIYSSTHPSIVHPHILHRGKVMLLQLKLNPYEIYERTPVNGIWYGGWTRAQEW